RHASVFQQIDCARQHRPYLFESFYSVPGALWQIYLLMRSEQSVHKALDFLFPHEGIMMNALRCLPDWHGRHLERVTGGLVCSQTIPKTVHQNMNQMIQVVHAFKRWKLAAPECLDGIKRRAIRNRRCDAAHQTCANRVKRRGTLVPVQQSEHL